MLPWRWRSPAQRPEDNQDEPARKHYHRWFQHSKRRIECNGWPFTGFWHSLRQGFVFKHPMKPRDTLQQIGVLFEPYITQIPGLRTFNSQTHPYRLKQLMFCLLQLSSHTPRKGLSPLASLKADINWSQIGCIDEMNKGWDCFTAIKLYLTDFCVLFRQWIFARCKPRIFRGVKSALSDKTRAWRVLKSPQSSYISLQYINELTLRWGPHFIGSITTKTHFLPTLKEKETAQNVLYTEDGNQIPSKLGRSEIFVDVFRTVFWEDSGAFIPRCSQTFK